jgi:hypothetical protein
LITVLYSKSEILDYKNLITQNFCLRKARHVDAKRRHVAAAVDRPLRERRICSGDVGMLSIGQINTCMAETAPSLPHAQTGNRRLTTPKARKIADAIGGAY